MSNWSQRMKSFLDEHSVFVWRTGGRDLTASVVIHHLTVYCTHCDHSFPADGIRNAEGRFTVGSCPKCGAQDRFMYEETR